MMCDVQELRQRLAEHDILSVNSDSSTENFLEGMEIQESLLRALPCSMKKKHSLRKLLRASPGKHVSCWVALCKRQRWVQRQLQEGISNFARVFQLWKTSLDEVGGNFGSGIQSYFTILRFLLLVNLLAVLLASGFILLPLVTIPRNGAIIPQTLDAGSECLNYSCGLGHRPPWQRFQDIFTGEGSLECSYLFYGAYSVGENDDRHYLVCLAYLFSILGYLVACFIWIFQRIVASFMNWQILQWGFKPYVSARIFTEWDFCIQSPEAAALKQRSIYNGLKMDLAEQIRHLQNQQRTRKQLAQLYLLRLLINAVVLLLMATAFYFIHLATESSQGDSQDAARLGVLSQYLPPVTISAVNILLPFVFHALAQLEGYSPNTEVNLTLVRCVILKLSSLAMFLFFLGRQILCLGASSTPQCQPCGYNKVYQCWETHIGQEMYKMTIFSFLTTLASAFLISLPRRLLAKHSSSALAQWLGKEEFLVPHNVLDIVATQTVIWIGIYFCPLLPLLGCVSIFLTFYIKKYTLFQNCQPSTQLFRASRSKFLFQIMLLLGLFLACSPLSYVITRVPPSQACGLFANYSAPWQTVPEAVSHLPTTAQLIFNYATSSVFCFLLLMVLSLVLIVFVSQTQANRQAIERLKRQRVQYVQEKWCLVRKLAQLMAKSP
nr:transmembrane channel-like protein 8 [Pogona vitticeps]